MFRTLLPAATLEANETGAAPPEVVAGRRGRILAVDDEPMLCTVIQRVLGIDHDVTTVGSAKEALRMLGDGERYDLILCDLMMPEMTGIAFHARLQQSAPDQAAKIMFMTGGAFTESTQAFLAEASNEFDREAVQGQCAARTGPPVHFRVSSLNVGSATSADSFVAVRRKPYLDSALTAPRNPACFSTCSSSLLD